MNYKSGKKIKISDIVKIEKGKTIGKIYDIIDTKEKQEEWGVDKCGVLIEAEPFGLVFYSLDDLVDIKYTQNINS